MIHLSIKEIFSIKSEHIKANRQDVAVQGAESVFFVFLLR